MTHKFVADTKSCTKSTFYRDDWSLLMGLAFTLYHSAFVTCNIRYRFNTTSHSRVLHTQVHNPILARESTRTSRLGKVYLESRKLVRTASDIHMLFPFYVKLARGPTYIPYKEPLERDFRLKVAFLGRF